MKFSDVMNDTLSFRVPQELYNEVKAFAAKHDMRLSDAAREFCAAGSKSLHNAAKPNEFLEFLLSLGYESVKDAIDANAAHDVTEKWLDYINTKSN